MSPLANSYLTAAQLGAMEPFYPLCAYVCDTCFLAQLEVFESPDHIFGDYVYFSSYSDTWLEHARHYVDMAIRRFGLDSASRAIEVASNDGYLLQYFLAKGIPVLGIEPARNVAQAALRKGIPTLDRFFGKALASQLVDDGFRADLLVGNNVLAHVPDLNDFVEGIKIVLKDDGVATLEFPHLMRLMIESQFDTIYHEHFSYFSFFTVERVFAAHDLTVFDVEELPTHGGSLRIYVRNTDDSSKPISHRLADLRSREETTGLMKLGTYLSFGEAVKEIKWNLLDFLIAVKRKGKSVVGYGAPAKGNTLLNYCGVGTDFIDYTVDRSPHKQGRFLPGTHIPIHHPRRKSVRPDRTTC
jgi:SAM-dependent methyltransferase